MTLSTMDRVWPKVQFGDWQDCWLWTGPLQRDGYARLSMGRRTRSVHRLVYEELVGPISNGLVLDHVREWGCVNRHCVNPLHLEPVTPRENTRRSRTAPAAVNARKTHCIADHPYDEVNSYTDRAGHRHCRTCEATRQRSPRGKSLHAARQRRYLRRKDRGQ